MQNLSNYSGNGRKVFLITALFICFYPLEIYSQHRSSSNNEIETIKEDLRELKSIYLDKLSYQDGKMTEELMDKILLSLDRLEDRHNHKQNGTESYNGETLILSNGEFQGLIHSIKQISEENKLMTGIRMDPNVYCLSSDQIAALMAFVATNYVLIIPPHEFNKLTKQVKDAFPDNEKYILITKAAVQYYFTTNQVMSLLNEFSFDKDKLILIELIIPRIADLDMVYKLSGTLTFSSSKDELVKIINMYKAER